MNNKLIDENIEYLLKVILELQSFDECYDFFVDLCTIQELKSLSQRLYVAKLLSDKHVYNEIVELTGASTATISRVNRTLQYGNGSYNTLFERLSRKADK